MDCQICFCENCDRAYTCSKCKKNICFECLDMYIKSSTDFLRCACTEYIFPSKLNGLPNRDLYIKKMLNRIETNFFEDLHSGSSIEHIRTKRREALESLPLCIKFMIETSFKKELKDCLNKAKTKQINMTMICKKICCNGIIKDYSCVLCSTKYCDLCDEVKDSYHSCNREDVLSREFISNMSIKCPNCHLPIEKSSGCNYMTCAVCLTKFDHHTGELSTNGGHSVKVNVAKTNLVTFLTDKYELPETVLKKLKALCRNRTSTKKIIELYSKDKLKAILAYEMFLKQQQVSSFLQKASLNEIISFFK